MSRTVGIKRKKIKFPEFIAETRTGLFYAKIPHVLFVSENVFDVAHGYIEIILRPSKEVNLITKAIPKSIRLKFGKRKAEYSVEKVEAEKPPENLAEYQRLYGKLVLLRFLVSKI